MAIWKKIGCDFCDSSGKRRDAGDMYSDECRDCNGSGVVWASYTGRIASYPGGPFLGRMSAEEIEREAGHSEDAP